ESENEYRATSPASNMVEEDRALAPPEVIMHRALRRTRELPSNTRVRSRSFHEAAGMPTNPSAQGSGHTSRPGRSPSYRFRWHFGQNAAERFMKTSRTIGRPHLRHGRPSRP